MTYKFKYPKLPSRNKMEKFFLDLGLKDLVELSKSKKLNKNLEAVTLLNQPYVPELEDLYLIYKLVEINKRTTILEIGSGWSSLIIKLALDKLKKNFTVDAKKLRRKNLFEIFILESENKYLKTTKDLIKKYSIDTMNMKYLYSTSNMTTYDGQICHEFNKLPNCNPDFIYLDGPGKDIVKKKINNITVSKNFDMPVMSCDILKIEFFLIPGTIVLIDGRGANTNFLRKNFKRKWEYKYFKKYDQHVFILQDNSFGKINDNLLKFYK